MCAVCIAGRPINYIKDIRSSTHPFASGPGEKVMDEAIACHYNYFYQTCSKHGRVYCRARVRHVLVGVGGGEGTDTHENLARVAGGGNLGIAIIKGAAAVN